MSDADGSVTPGHRVGKDRRPPTPRTSLTVYQYKWGKLGCEWWETGEEAEEGPNKGKWLVKNAVTEQFLFPHPNDGFKAQFSDARCDRDRYGCTITALCCVAPLMCVFVSLFLCFFVSLFL